MEIEDAQKVKKTVPNLDYSGAISSILCHWIFWLMLLGSRQPRMFGR
jgi:hypothetical protein